MKKLNVSMLLTIGMSFLFICCADKEENPSVDVFGNCTRSFANAYEEVSRNLNFTFFNLRNITTANLNNAHQSCQSFFNVHNDVRCKADVDGTVRYVSSSDLKKDCDNVALILSGQGLPQGVLQSVGKTAEKECAPKHIKAYEAVVKARDTMDSNLGMLCSEYHKDYGNITCESDISPRERAKITPKTLHEICGILEV